MIFVVVVIEWGARQIAFFQKNLILVVKSHPFMTDLDKILAIVTKHYGQWEKNPTRMENGYEYESTFASMTQEMEKEMLKVSLGKLPISRNDKKKLLQDLAVSKSQKVTF